MPKKPKSFMQLQRKANPRPQSQGQWNHLYDYRWKKCRKAFLREHCLCTDCEEAGKCTPATEVHHQVAHRGNLLIFWDESRWMALCRSCHSRRTSRGE